MIPAEHPTIIEGDALTRRIFAPAAYRLARDTAVVPIVAGEAFRLASCFPVVWRRRESRTELVAVRALLDDVEAQTPAFRAAYPLALQAYPFLLASSTGSDGVTRLLDHAVADAPTDVGASVTTTDGRPSYATTLRLRMLDVIERQLPFTDAIGRSLVDADLLEPWELTFDIDGTRIGIPDLLVARQSAFDTGAYSEIVARHGAPAAELLALHRISLFRAGLLLVTARAFVKRRNQGAAEIAARVSASLVPRHDTDSEPPSASDVVLSSQDEVR
ncbi:SapC family protein [Rhodoplanes roseus]|uniref:SapC family protein n=1 Tax=Rhodoplanes roseus TaxID=29409 RepID=A0A327L3M4_9BRAD|nr:SapC family protein [Rhodoplanes roseus]RAI44997.1 hypothetical protein CH341_06180 [Rhodoplanes roseus]